MADMSISGIVSGMDWDSIIDKLITKAAAPAQVQVSKRTSLQNKKSLFEEMKVMVQSMQSSMTSLKLPSTYKAKEIEIENMAGGSYKKILTATVNADAEVNVHDLKVNQIATAQTVRSLRMAGSTIESYTKNQDSVFYINAGGQKVAIEVKATDTLQSLKSRINNTLKTLDNPIAITASVVDNRLILKSDSTGLGTKTLEGTARGGYSATGATSLKGLITNAETGGTVDIIVTEDNYDKFKITSTNSTGATKTYEYDKDKKEFKDFSLVNNGTEIRWKQYEDTKNEVKLGESINAKYIMSADDVYEAKGTYGKEEAAVTGFKVIDNGTLSSRLTIKDDNDRDYTYGKDFTLDDKGQVVWLEAESSTTKEPASYTVKFSKNATLSTNEITQAKASKGPTSFTVSYTKELIGPLTVKLTTKYTSAEVWSELNFNTLTSGLAGTSTETTNCTFLKFDKPEEASLVYTPNNGGSTQSYTYGSEYVFRDNTDKTETEAVLVFPSNKNYLNPQGTSINSSITKPQNGYLTFSYKHEYTSQNEISDEIRAAAGSDYSGIKITSPDGKIEYKQGIDFNITDDGKIEWLYPSADDEIVDDENNEETFIDNLNAKYKAAYGSNIPTVTLTDSNEVLRTYLDPANLAEFKMTAEVTQDDGTTKTETYEYGRDYVIRVSDDGQGYVFSWTISSDTNGDETRNILDTNASVTAYTQYKGLTTYGMKASPLAGKNYSFTFIKDDIPVNKTVEVTAPLSETLEGLLNNNGYLTNNGIDTSTNYWESEGVLTITDKDGNVFKLGTDYTIDDTGKITWLDKTSGTTAPENFKVNYTAFSSQITRGSTHWDYLSDDQHPNNSAVASPPIYSSQLVSAGVPFTPEYAIPSTSNYRQYVNGKDNATYLSITATASSGTQYNEYEDFFILTGPYSSQGGTPPDTRISWLKESNNWSGGYVTNYSTTQHKAPNANDTYTLSFKYTADSTASEYSEHLDKIIKAAGANGNYQQIEITDASGTPYVYGKDYTINSLGITWLNNPEHPAEGVGYNLEYKPFSPLTVNNITLDSDVATNPTEVKITLDSETGTTLTYDQLLKYADIAPADQKDGAKVNASLSKLFTLKDSSGTTYAYGEDYKITGDSTSTKIEWLSDKPTAGTNFTLIYGSEGGEEIQLSATHSAIDAITDPNFNFPTYSQFDSADSIRITDGVNEYYRGIDFDVDYTATLTDKDGNTVPVGEPLIKWNTDDQGTPKYLPWFGEAKEYLTGYSSTTLTYPDGTVMTDYVNIAYDDTTGDATLTLNNTNLTALEAGTYSLAVKKGDFTKTFKLTSDGTNMSLSIPDDAPTITVTKSDGTTITDYKVSSDNPGNPVFTKQDGTALDDGKYEVKVVKNGATRVFDLKSDGTITQRSNWRSQDNTQAGNYTIYVSSSTGATQQFSGIRPAGTYDFYFDNSAASPLFSEVKKGTVTVTQGYKTFYEGEDFEFEVDPDSYTYDKNGKLIVDDDGDPVGRAVIKWKAGGDEWYYPNPGSSYTINLTNPDGTSKSYTAIRTASETIDMMKDYGLTTAKGIVSAKTGTENGEDVYTQLWKYEDDAGREKINYVGNDELLDAYSYTITKNYDNTFAVNWFTPNRTSREGLPAYGDELKISYEYDANEFTLSDDSKDGQSGILDLLGLSNKNWYTRDEDGNKIDNAEFFTSAHNAIIELNGNEIQRDSNDIGESYDNEIAELKGVTLHLKGVGEVSLDIAHDAQKAVETIQTLVDGYNDLMQWINTRMTEKQVDKDTKATIDSDDFRMRWGLLHGNSLLRNTKSQMRSLISQNFNFGFTQRGSSQEIYGTMALNGLKNDATLRLRIGSKFVDVPVLMTDTIQDIVDKINDSSDPAMRSIYYDDEGKLLEVPLLKASVNDDRLVISSASNDEITMSGSSAMNALKMNYTYKGLYQLGLATTSTDYGKSGELEFDTSKFMEALEDEPDEVQELMLIFANQMDSWLKSMTTTSASGETSGTLTRQIEDLDTQIASIDEYLEKYQDRLDRQEETLRKRYAAAEEQFYKLSQQANSIASILSMMNGNNSGNSNYTASA